MTIRKFGLIYLYYVSALRVCQLDVIGAAALLWSCGERHYESRSGCGFIFVIQAFASIIGKRISAYVISSIKIVVPDINTSAI